MIRMCALTIGALLVQTDGRDCMAVAASYMGMAVAASYMAQESWVVLSRSYQHNKMYLMITLCCDQQHLYAVNVSYAEFILICWVFCFWFLKSKLAGLRNSSNVSPTVRNFLASTTQRSSLQVTDNR
jgi:hypothetical protein